MATRLTDVTINSLVSRQTPIQRLQSTPTTQNESCKAVIGSQVAFHNVMVQEVDESTAFPAKVIAEDTGIAGSVLRLPKVTVTPMKLGTVSGLDDAR